MDLYGAFLVRGAPTGKRADTATPQIHHENLIPGFHVASEMDLVKRCDKLESGRLDLQSYAIDSIDFNIFQQILIDFNRSYSLQMPKYPPL